MKETDNLTRGSVGRVLFRFVLPYLLSCFLQTFYGMADLFVVGVFNGSEVTAAVAAGSQVTHMLTVILVGMAMGVTVMIGRAVGAGDGRKAEKTVGTATVLFSVFAAVLTVILLLTARMITGVLQTPPEAARDTIVYLSICFGGIPFIMAYNVICAIFRGAGDSRRPMYFAGSACMVNILLDFIFIGVCHLGAAGAALGTVCGQAASVILAAVFLKKSALGFPVTRQSFRVDKKCLSGILKVGIPIAMQDGLIQVAFLVITAIANSRGLVYASGVGIVEKIISFLFLVPSAFLAAISAITAQNMGAGKIQRARHSLYYGLAITVGWGIICCLFSQFFPHMLVGMFTRDRAVAAAGCDYLRAYSFDCVFAAVHFCFSGYFCGIGKAGLSFIHNIAAIVLLRIPVAYLAIVYFPSTLYPMGWAAPLGSFLSAVLCIIFYIIICRNTLREKRV